MNFHLNKFVRFIKINTNLLSLSLYFLLTSTLFFSFFYLICKTTNDTLVPLSEKGSTQEQVTSVGSFITDSTEDTNAKIISYLKDFFSTRNQSFLTGNVENMYKFYDISHSYSKYSLHYEFKRISYLRDWANEKGITFVDISSTPYIMNVKTNNNIIKLNVNETFNVTYVYNENPSIKNKFTVTLFHTDELQVIGNGFTIQKDYYFDCFENSLKKYNFNLTEKELPITSYRLYNIDFK